MAYALAKASSVSSSIITSGVSSVAPRASVIPSEWYTDLLGPGQPISPQAPRDEWLNPRDIDYPIAANITFTPRVAYGLLTPFTLKSAYDTITEVSNPVNVVIREMSGFRQRFVNEDGDEVFHHKYQWLLDRPDGETPWDMMITRFLKCALVYDAGALRIRGSHGELEGADYIDGSTLMLIVNERGRLPRPDEVSQDEDTQLAYIEKARKWLAKGERLPATTPAYAQIIHGLPFSWWDQDQIWYKPRSRTMDSPYGESFIERSFGWINIIANVTGFELAHYQTGNMPEGWSETPEGWDESRTVTWEETFNARMSSGPAERMRVRFLPAGFQYHETKKPQFPVQLYEQARDNITLALGLPVSELGKVPGQGLGGKGFGEAMESALFRNALFPIKVYIEGAFNDILDKFGIDDVRVELALPVQDVDPEKQKDAITKMFTSGMYTLNDALGELGKDPVPGGDVHIVTSGGQVIVLEDYLKDRGQPEPAPKTPGDVETSRKLLENAANTGKLSTKTISIPSSVGGSKISKSQAEYADVSSDPHKACSLCKHYNGQGGCEIVDGPIAPQGSCDHFESPIEKGVNLVHPHDHNHHFAPKGGVDTGGAKRVGKEHGVNFEAGDWSALRTIVEQLIVDIESQQFAPITINKSADNLEKHCGVCPEDDEYFGADISREVSMAFPNDHHANGVDIVAATGEGLEPKPFLFKPEGEEVESLQDYIGGPQYVREEAAYLIDRALGFYLVPVAFVSEADDEMGAAVYYTHGLEGAYTSVAQYAPEWREKAAVLDCIIGQQDRGLKHNYATHPDDPTRPILFDNGLSFPDSEHLWPQSPFVDEWENKPLSQETLTALYLCKGDAAVWADVAALVGSTAAALARARLQRLLDEKMITTYEPSAVTS